MLVTYWPTGWWQTWRQNGDEIAFMKAFSSLLILPSCWSPCRSPCWSPSSLYPCTCRSPGRWPRGWLTGWSTGWQTGKKFLSVTLSAVGCWSPCQSSVICCRSSWRQIHHACHEPIFSGSKNLNYGLEIIWWRHFFWPNKDSPYLHSVAIKPGCHLHKCLRNCAFAWPYKKLGKFLILIKRSIRAAINVNGNPH